MINKLYFNGSKPPTYYMNNKRVRRMVFNNQIVYEYIPCTGLNIIPDSTQMDLTGSIGETYVIDYTVTPSDCTEPVTWSISSNNYFSISNGVVTRLVSDIDLDVEELDITITASCESFSDTTKLKLINDGSCTNFKFDENQVSINTDVIDETYYKLKYTLSPTDCTDEVTYELSDPNIIKVIHSKGTKEFWITTLSIGTCIITGRCGNKIDTCQVKVIDNSNS